MELRDLRLALRRHWVVAAIAFLACLAIGMAAAYLPERTYRASATVLAAPVGSGNPQGIASFSVPAVVEIVQSRGFATRSQTRVAPEFANDPVSISASNDLGTGIIRVQVESVDPEAAAAWATALARGIVAEQTTSVDQQLQLRVLDAAQVPSEPASPQPVPILLGAGVLGVLAALLSAVGVSRARQALDLAEEVRHRLGAPVLGEIPPVRRLRRSNGQLAEVLENGPPHLLEAFQRTRTNVELSFLGDNEESLAVTSWSAGEGKSTIAAGLALSLGAVGKDVVAIDADLRRPSLHIRLGEPFGEGLADLARVDAETVLRPTRIDCLSLMPAGIPDRHPADVVAVNLAKAKAMLRKEDRLLLIDAPPLDSVAETPVVLSVARNVILVVDSSSVRLPELEQAVRRMRESGLVLNGVVLNRVRSRGRRSARYNTYTPG